MNGQRVDPVAIVILIFIVACVAAGVVLGFAILDALAK